MHYPALQNYLSRLQSTLATTNLWLDEQGRARGRYFNSTLTSAFQAIRAGDDGRIVAYEAYARSYASDDQGLNIWKLLEKAGVPRYAEIVSIADEPGAAAAAFYLLKLMGFPDVKMGMP